VEPSEPKEWQAAIPGVDASFACRRRGNRHIARHACFAVWTNPERRPLVGQGIRYGSGKERKCEARTADLRVHRAGDQRNTSKATGNGEGQGGGGETNPPATLVDRAIPSHRKMRGGHEPHSA